MTTWQLIGEGFATPECGAPRSYHEFFDGTRVWGPKQCTRRACPKCADTRYLKSASDDITRTIMGWIGHILSKGELYDKKGRSLKIYKFRYSRCKDDDDLARARKGCREAVQRSGLLAGYSITHPYRGTHNKGDSPLECRAKMERSKLSIHIHGLAVGYWSESVGQETGEYYHSDPIVDIREWKDDNMPIETRGRLLNILQYDLGHAGWQGPRGQCVTVWGERFPDTYRPDRPHIYIQHPSHTEDKEPVWERRVKPSQEVHEELNEMIKEKEYGILPEIPTEGRTGPGGLHPWWSLGEITVEEFHYNWWPWRSTIANVIRSLIYNPS